MVNYYLDIETTGLDPETCKIITIQFQPLDFNTGNPIGKLTILKSWESSEIEILKQFQKIFDTHDKWGFIAHGYNLHFEEKFLRVRSQKYYGLKPIELFSKPTIDLHPVGIMLNSGFFKGSGLDKISGKMNDGMYVLECYTANMYDKIEDYIVQETEEYIKLYVWLRKEMPKLLVEYRKILGDKED